MLFSLSQSFSFSYSNPYDDEMTMKLEARKTCSSGYIFNRTNEWIFGFDIVLCVCVCVGTIISRFFFEVQVSVPFFLLDNSNNNNISRGLSFFLVVVLIETKFFLLTWHYLLGLFFSWNVFFFLKYSRERNPLLVIVGYFSFLFWS